MPHLDSLSILRRRLLPSLFRLMACLICLAAGSRPLAVGGEPSPKPDPAALERAVRELNDDRYYVRERATDKLAHMGAHAVPALAQAALDDNLEVSLRAIRVLSDLAVATDDETALGAQQALRALADSPLTSAASRAEGALDLLERVRAERALDQLKRHGAVFLTQDVFEGTTLRRIQLGRTWTGGTQGLALLRWVTDCDTLSIRNLPLTDADIAPLATLRQFRKVELYGTKISSDAAKQLADALPGVVIDRRAGGLLGIQGGPQEQGCEILFVKPGSGAEAAGLEIGDVITRFGDEAVTGFDDLTALIAQRAGGEKVKVDYVRNGETASVDVTLGEWE